MLFAIIVTVIAIEIISKRKVVAFSKKADKAWALEFRHWIQEMQNHLNEQKCAVIPVEGWNALFVPSREEAQLICMMSGVNLPAWAEMAIFAPHPSSTSENIWRAYIMHEVTHLNQYLSGQIGEKITFIARVRAELPDYLVTFQHLSKDVGWFHSAVFCASGFVHSTVTTHLYHKFCSVASDAFEWVDENMKERVKKFKRWLKS